MGPEDQGVRPLPDSPLSDTRPSLPLQTLVRYILKQDVPSSLEDSLRLAEAYKLPTSQINTLYLIQLMDQGKVSRSSSFTIHPATLFSLNERLSVWSVSVSLQTEACVTLLKRLPSCEAECVIGRLTTWARLHLQDKDHLCDEVRSSNTPQTDTEAQVF